MANSRGSNSILFFGSYRNGNLNVDWMSNERFCWPAYKFFRVSIVIIMYVRKVNIIISFVNTIQERFDMWKHETVLSCSFHGTRSTDLEVDLLLWYPELYKAYS
jgi:hypothetical protein